MSDGDVLEILRRFVLREVGSGLEIDPTTPLLEGGLVDSMTLVFIISFVEDRFGVEIPPTELRTERLRTLTTIAELVAELRDARDAGG